MPRPARPGRRAERLRGRAEVEHACPRARALVPAATSSPRRQPGARPIRSAAATAGSRRSRGRSPAATSAGPDRRIDGAAGQPRGAQRAESASISSGPASVQPPRAPLTAVELAVGAEAAARAVDLVELAFHRCPGGRESQRARDEHARRGSQRAPRRAGAHDPPEVVGAVGRRGGACRRRRRGGWSAGSAEADGRSGIAPEPEGAGRGVALAAEVAGAAGALRWRGSSRRQPPRRTRSGRWRPQRSRAAGGADAATRHPVRRDRATAPGQLDTAGVKVWQRIPRVRREQAPQAPTAPPIHHRSPAGRTSGRASYGRPQASAPAMSRLEIDGGRRAAADDDQVRRAVDVHESRAVRERGGRIHRAIRVMTRRGWQSDGHRYIGRPNESCPRHPAGLAPWGASPAYRSVSTTPLAEGAVLAAEGGRGAVGRNGALRRSRPSRPVAWSSPSSDEQLELHPA